MLARLLRRVGVLAREDRRLRARADGGARVEGEWCVCEQRRRARARWRALARARARTWMSMYSGAAYVRLRRRASCGNMSVVEPSVSVFIGLDT